MSVLQLDLFAGKVLTTKQIEQADKYVITNDKIEREKYEHFNMIKNLFSKYEMDDIIICDYRLENKTYDKKFNTWSDTNKFEKEISVVECKGGIKVKYFRFDDKNKLICNDVINVWISDIDFRNHKIQMSTITDNYRYYKFSSINKKISEYNNETLRKFKYAKDVLNASNKITADFKNKYPNAVVTEYFADIKEWDKWRNVRCVKVTFKSGSYVEYKVYSNASTTLIKSKDMQKESVEQMIERFNLQS